MGVNGLVGGVKLPVYTAVPFTIRILEKYPGAVVCQSPPPMITPVPALVIQEVFAVVPLNIPFTYILLVVPSKTPAT